MRFVSLDAKRDRVAWLHVRISLVKISSVKISEIIYIPRRTNIIKLIGKVIAAN